MYLENGREIYESDKYPGYYIDANTGDFCDEEGNYIGGNQDDGDEPGGRTAQSTVNKEYVYVTKSGCQYYPKRTKSANIAMSLEEAKKKGYRASKGYRTFKAHEAFKKFTRR